VKYVFVPLAIPKNRRGFAEKALKKRLEKNGWSVWRAGLIGMENPYPEYPAVAKKYQQLHLLLKKYCPRHLEQLHYINAVHHGLPDFICMRNNKFLFVECKLVYESLSKKQKKCIALLQRLGFSVEVHKVVDERTKTRIAFWHQDKKIIVERQSALA